MRSLPPRLGELVALVTLTVLAPVAGAATECVDYSQYLRWTAGTDFDCFGVEPLSGSLDGYLIAADEDFGMRVVDVSTPGEAVIVATVPTPSPPHSVDAVGPIALSVEAASWRLVDVSNPTSPVLGYGNTPGLRSIPAGILDRRTDLLGEAGAAPDVAYIGWSVWTEQWGTEAAIDVLDVSDPFSYRLIASIPLGRDSPRSLRHVQRIVNGAPRSFLYVASGSLRILDVTDPASPFHAASHPLNTADITSDGDFAYAAVGGSIRVLGVADPTQPVQVGIFVVPGTPEDLALVGTDLYVSCGWSGVHIVDVRDPLRPAIRRTVRTPLQSRQARVLGTRLFVADRSRGLHVFDVKTLERPPTMAVVDTPGDALKIQVSGDHAYLADGEAGLRVFDIGDPDLPVAVGVLPPQVSGSTHRFVDVEIAGQPAYVAGLADGFHLIDISDPPHPNWAVPAPPLPYANAVEIAGDFAYVISSHPEFGFGVTILDLPSGVVPAIVGDLPLPPNLNSHVSLIGDVLYVGSWNNGLWTIDVSDPSAPVQVGELPGNYFAVTPAGGPACTS